MSKNIWCKNYRAMSEHSTCSVGIEYESMKGLPFDKRPCFQPCGGCERAIYPTSEEIAAREAWLKQRFENTGKAREAIVNHLGGPWKRGMPSAGGKIDCPVCAGKATLHFSRSGYNGHIHAKCATDGCVSWME